MQPITTPPNPFFVDGAIALPSFEQWFYLPGDWALYALLSRAPAVADLLGLVSVDYGGTVAGFVAWVLWVLLAIALIAATSALRRFDRALTDRIVGGVAGLRRRIRMAIAFARYRQRVRTQRLEATFDVREPAVRLRRHMR